MDLYGRDPRYCPSTSFQIFGSHHRVIQSGIENRLLIGRAAFHFNFGEWLLPFRLGFDLLPVEIEVVAFVFQVPPRAFHAQSRKYPP